MNMKAVYLQSKVRECCANARSAVLASETVMAIVWLNRALAHARQMPDCPKWRCQRAYLAQAAEALADRPTSDD